MDTLQNSKHLQQRRKGQTLAEFAITLPIVLILLFGIVEFGRIFQAWVTLQNAARTAARYASTGQFFEAQFPLNLNLNAATPSDPGGFIPCVDDGPEDWRTYNADGQDPSFDRRGTKTTYTPPGADSETFEVYEGGIESLFATWNDGKNCDPGSDADQERRRDMARILSIMEEARRGAAGLAIEFNQLQYPTDKTQVEDQPWFEVWKNPQPRNDQRSWFNVVICSTRKRLDQENSGRYFKLVDESGTNDVDTRFVTNLGDATLRDQAGTDLTTADAPIPSCLLNEIPAVTADGLNNAGKPWLDPGGPADTVMVIITFNHPLITPLGLAPYIQMQARRTAIVESFRAADPRTVLGGGAPIRPPEPTLTATNTEVPPTATNTSEPATKTPTRAPTATATQPPPFTCSLITASSLVVNGGRIEVSIRNQNTDATFLTRVIVKWPTILQYADMALIEMALNEAPHWRGRDTSDINAQTNTTDTNAQPSNPNYFTDPDNELDRTIAGYDTGLWSSTFSNGPTFLQQYVSMYDFAGTTFYLFNPLDPNNPCAIQLVLPTPTDVPVGYQSPTPTPTFTPDCASAEISVRWGGFEAFGLVRLEVRNARNVQAVLSDFSIQWRQRAPGVLTLSRVTVVAPLGQPGSVTVWQASSLSQDSTPPTNGRAEAAWVSNFTFDPAIGPGQPSVTNMYLDFDGVGGLLSDVGVTPSDFNGTQFRLSCGTTGGGTNGPGGGPPSGLINLVEAPTPAPTNTRGPTRTPAPTLTPSKTFTPAPPTNTPTRGPTNTPRPPTNTPLAPTATTPPPPPTLPGGGCVDNCG